MVGILGVIAAGAAQGARTTSNSNVDIHNQEVKDNLRRKYEQMDYQRNRGDAEADYQRNRADNKEDAHAQGVLNQTIRLEDRENQVADDALAHDRKLKEIGVQERHKNSRAAMKNGGTGDKAQSPWGKKLDDLVNRGVAKDHDHAADILHFQDGFKLSKESNPFGSQEDHATQARSYADMFKKRDEGGEAQSAGNLRWDGKNLVDPNDTGLAEQPTEQRQVAPQPAKQKTNPKPEQPAPEVTPDQLAVNAANQQFNNDTSEMGAPPPSTRSADSREFNNQFGNDALLNQTNKTAEKATVKATINGEKVEIPLNVPTLTREEREILMKGGKPTQAMINKAVAYAKQTMGQDEAQYAGI